MTNHSHTATHIRSLEESLVIHTICEVHTLNTHIGTIHHLGHIFAGGNRLLPTDHFNEVSFRSFTSTGLPPGKLNLIAANAATKGRAAILTHKCMCVSTCLPQRPQNIFIIKPLSIIVHILLLFLPLLLLQSCRLRFPPLPALISGGYFDCAVDRLIT